MERIIEDNDRARRRDPIIDNLFFAPRHEQQGSAGSEPGQEFPETTSPPADTKTPAAEPEWEQSVVKWFDTEKGYGFLLRPGDYDLFLHRSDVDGDASILKEGDEIEYVIGHR